MFYWTFLERVKYYILLCYVKYGETLNFSLDKQMERVVEVLALSALLQASTEQIIKNREAVKRLKDIAFPLEIEL